MIFRNSFFCIFFLLYCLSFFLQEQFTQITPIKLSHPLPTKVQKVALGYLKQLRAEIGFIKTNIFLGGTEPGRDPLTYATSLAHNFFTITELHPLFLDTYFLCQSSLPYINDENAQKANKIHEKGIKALPENWVLPFFVGFNHFYYLNNPQKASEILYHASYLPEAPQKPLQSLASILAAEGGNIYGGLLWLKGMLATEKDETMRERYKKRITIFEQAVVVQKAIERYKKQYNHYPLSLDALTPEILKSLPELSPPFSLSWTPPILQLVRKK